MYKYGGQPFVRDYLAQHHGNQFDNAFGKGTGKAIMHATAGRYAFVGDAVDLSALADLLLVWLESERSSSSRSMF